jgi:SufS family cysteine desulfurase
MNNRFDSARMRAQFPIFSGSTLAYLDSAVTSQKPESVIDRMNLFYRTENANVHRGVYRLSESATAAFEGSRKKIATWLGGVKDTEIIFTRGTTESLNLVAFSWCQANLHAGDEIVLSISEHHSNIVPWQLAASRCGATIRYIPLTANYRLDMDEARKIITSRTKLVAFAHVSNVLGVIHPVAELIALAKKVGAITVIDGAQAVPHFDVNVLELGCDFYAFSGHKMVGPTGIGVLYGREELLKAMPPYQGGGDMIERVLESGSTWNCLPYKFEAGTPNIAGAVGLGAAVDFFSTYDRKAAFDHDVALGKLLYSELKDRKNIRVYYDGHDAWVGVLTFYHQVVHPHDLAAIADAEGVCIRAGHHCAQPLMARLGVPATSRVSPYIYNSSEDILRAVAVIDKAEQLFNC